MRNERELGVRRWRSMNGKNQVIRNARPTQKEQLQAQSETYMAFRSIFNWMWKVNRNFISSACDLVSRVFLRFRQFACCNLEFSLDVVITLVFVLRHSIEVRIFHFSVNHKRNETCQILKLFLVIFFSFFQIEIHRSIYFRRITTSP